MGVEELFVLRYFFEEPPDIFGKFDVLGGLNAHASLLPP